MEGIAKIHILMFLEKILYVSAVGFFFIGITKLITLFVFQ
jgi:hypothetical protein